MTVALGYGHRLFSYDMRIIKVDSISDSQLDIYRKLTDAQLRQFKESETGVFIAESPKVIRVALNAGYTPISLLCEEKHIKGDAADIIQKCGETMPVYTGPRDVLSALTGYTLTRGVLCAMHRPILPSIQDVCAKSRRIVVIDGVVDTTNIGAIFRSAAALGMDAVLLTRNSCDPLNRRAIRVSMGSIFLIPWTWIDGDLVALRKLGFKTVAMALTDNSISIDSPQLVGESRLAIIMGTEGDGLPMETIRNADYVARIPMHYGVDSLNVAAASAIAFWQLGKNPSSDL